MNLGLGDQGYVGLDEFASQHICNSICKEFGWEPLEGFLDFAGSSGSNRNKSCEPGSAGTLRQGNSNGLGVDGYGSGSD
jgi:hypothetical protein